MSQSDPSGGSSVNIEKCLRSCRFDRKYYGSADPGTGDPGPGTGGTARRRQIRERGGRAVAGARVGMRVEYFQRR